MKILFTGKTDFKYNRVRVLLAGLEQLNDVRTEVIPIKSRKTFDKAAFKKAQEKADFVYIPPFRHRDVSFIKKLTDKPIVFDPLISKYLTKAVDYGHWWKGPAKYFLDYIPFRKCDILLADTETHRRYFIRKFNVNPQKTGVVPVGVDTDRFFPSLLESKKEDKFIVGCYGSFVPLQGMLKIVQTAKLLEDKKDIVIHLIGTGSEYEKVRAYAKKHNIKNVVFKGWIDYNELNIALNEFDLTLGIFGDSEKADSVIPNKIYHFASLGKCILSKDTQAIREAFTDNENIILCPNKPEIMAEKIIALQKHPEQRTKIGAAALALIESGYNHIHIAKKLVKTLKEYKTKKAV